MRYCVLKTINNTLVLSIILRRKIFCTIPLFIYSHHSVIIHTIHLFVHLFIYYKYSVTHLFIHITHTITFQSIHLCIYSHYSVIYVHIILNSLPRLGGGACGLRHHLWTLVVTIDSRCWRACSASCCIHTCCAVTSGRQGNRFALANSKL